ncbi:MAG TPA: hypothetical protein VEU62_15800, partial [Bryobacterales bacterium]|nr:hypothetical protein [Bryobacterales bacterium]
MWRKICGISLLVFCFSSLGNAADVTLSPLVARPGDSFTIIVTVDNCTGDRKNLLDADSVSVDGNDITIDRTKANPADCTLSVPASVAAKPVSLQHIITVTSKKDNGLHGAFDFRIVDIAAGPIPPGLSPQVDVMWDVMSEHNCSDQFGVRTARHYFCVDVQLGNNSGYPLILSGVGFLRSGMRQSTASYLTVRSVVQREHVISGRNATLRVLQTAGVIIAGFEPFTGNAARSGRIGIWSSLVGTVLASAWDGLVPDRTVPQAANLDDAALRDGKVVPNNSPVRFTVFVDRDEIAALLQDAVQLRYAANLARTLASNLRAQADKPENAGRRADLNKQAGALEAAVEDLDQEAAKATNGQAPMVGSRINPLHRHRPKAEENLLVVRLLLGDLIVVGDEIEYKQRVQVSSSAVSPERLQAPQIKLKGSDTVTVDQDGKGAFELSGTSLAGAVPNVTIRNAAGSKSEKLATKDFSTLVTADGITITITKVDAAYHDGGKVDISVTAGGATSNTVTFTLKKQVAAPRLDAPASDAATVSVAANGNAEFKLTGASLANAT